MTIFRNILLLGVLAVIISAGAAQENARPSGVASPEQAATGQKMIDCGVFAARDPKLDLVSRLCTFALTYRGKLPDFIVRQTTTSKGPASTVVLTAQVTYSAGVERHLLLSVNGKPVKPKERIYVDLRLVTSGEFGPQLINLFEVPDTVEFTFRKTETLQDVRVAVFDFQLPKDKNSFWAIRDPRGETIKPEFRGRLWLDENSGHILREEVQPVVNAYSTGLTSMKLSTDYAMTKVKDAGTFLLPVKSESTVCTSHLGNNLGCTTNVIAFHGYQKFAATTRVLPTEQGP